MSVFLTAEWRMLAMMNWAVDPALLQPLVPAGTELDFFDGKTFVSLVGFRFLNTRVKGVAIPFHENFEEVNLRFYVRRREGEELRRGVVFVKEIVPRAAIAWVARSVFHENYVSLPMRYKFQQTGANRSVSYGWDSSVMRADFHGEPALAAAGSIEQFITEHYWGYTLRRDGRTAEYRVAHEPWRVWTATGSFSGDTTALYGVSLSAIILGPPHSALVAEGSPVTVHSGRILSPVA